MAKSVSRRRFGSSGGAPLRVSASPATTTAKTPKAADPFATYVKDLNNQLKVFQDEAAIRKLAEGDPEGFIPLAEQRLKEGNTSYPWASLIRQAKEKIDNDQWASDIKDGTKSLDEFKTHLEGKLGKLPPGSQEANDMLRNISSVNTAIKAKAEAAKDQAALQSYINSGDHKAYRDYLSAKLNRTVDPALQSALVKNISEMDSRIAAQASVERAQKVSEALVAFRQGATITDTITKLQEVAHDKAITPAEVNHIQTVIDSVFNKAASDARSAAAGRAAAQGRAVTAKLNVERTALEAAKTNIANKLKAGQPITQADLDKVDAAAAVVQHMSEAIAADPNTTASTSRTAANEAASAGAAPNKVRGMIDTKTMKDFGLDSSGKTAFAGSLKGLSPAKQAQAWITRAKETNMALGKLYLDDSKQQAQDASTIAYNMSRYQIQELTKPAPLSQDEKDALHNQYLDYRDAMVTRGLTPKSETEFAKTAGSAADAASAAKALGLPDDAVAGFAPVFENDISPLVNRGAKYFRGDFMGDPSSTKNLKDAMDLQDQLIRAQFGNDVSLDKTGLYYVASGQVSAADTVASLGLAAPKRRAGGLIEGGTDMTIPVDRTPVETYGGQGGQGGKFMSPTFDQPQPDGGDAMLTDGNGQGVGLGGYIDDQRQELFGNPDPYAGATTYLSKNSFVDVPAWSMPDIPAFDPVVPFMSPDAMDRNSAYREQYFGEPDNGTPSTTPADSSGPPPSEAPTVDYLGPHFSE